MQVLKDFGLFNDAPEPALQTGEPVTWATFVNTLAKRKGALDVHEHFVSTYGEAAGKPLLQMLEGCGNDSCECHTVTRRRLKIISGVPVAASATTAIDAVAALLVDVLKYEVGLWQRCGV